MSDIAGLEALDTPEVAGKSSGRKGGGRSAASALMKLFIGYSKNDEHDHAVGFGYGAGAGGVIHTTDSVFQGGLGDTPASGMGDASGAVGDEPELPLDRIARYSAYEAMAREPMLSEGLALHLTHALSVSKRTGLCFEIVPDGDDDGEIASEIMNDIGFRLNKLVPVVAKIMCVYGVNYVKPHFKEGVGITHFETGYYTLPHFVREYERAGELAGFTCDHYLDNGRYTAKLQPPWEFIAMKIPYWSPDSRIQPLITGNDQVDISVPPELRRPQETQNYGTSLFSNTYGSYVSFRESMRCLRGARQISGNIERLIGLNTESLDPVRAATYMNQIAASMKKAVDNSQKTLSKRGLFPTVFNRFIPIMGGGKGSMTVDTQVNTADIQHIEDVMMHVRRMAASIGHDMSMLGWADMMSGGLGEGGFLRTSLQAGMRAQWIRFAVQDFIEKAIDIHMAAKHGKAFTDSYRPYKVVFNSLNTALQEEENAERQSRAEFASVIVTVLDTIQNGSLAHTETFKRLMLTGTLDASEEMVEEIIKELAGAVDAMAEGDDMMESARNRFADLTMEDIEDVMRSVIT
ncbi:MAG: hypothetical protein ACRDBJ_02525, partial [Plesiomonas shigelloides]